MKKVFIAISLMVVLFGCSKDELKHESTIEIDTTNWIETQPSDTIWSFYEDSVTGELVPVIEII